MRLPTAIDPTSKNGSAIKIPRSVAVTLIVSISSTNMKASSRRSRDDERHDWHAQGQRYGQVRDARESIQDAAKDSSVRVGGHPPTVYSRYIASAQLTPKGGRWVTSIHRVAEKESSRK
jgi:hypothetical protein